MNCSQVWTVDWYRLGGEPAYSQMWTDALFSLVSNAFSIVNTGTLGFFKKFFIPSHDYFIILLHTCFSGCLFVNEVNVWKKKQF